MPKLTQYLKMFLIAASVMLVSCASNTSDPSEAYKTETEQQVFQKGETALRDKNYAEAIKRFEALDVQYPFSANTQVAQLHVIYAYYKNSDFASAEAAADRYIRSYPTSPHVDYAYYMRGVSNYFQNMGVFERFFSVDLATRDLTQIKKSYNDFASLVNQHPSSPYAPAAHQYMIYLRNVLALHQLEVADFYYGKEAYVASANRASLVVQHYQGAPYVPDALVMMAKSYHHLGMTDLEKQTVDVIRYNYANTPYWQAVSPENITAAPEPISGKKYVIVARPVVAENKVLPPAYQGPGPREKLAEVKLANSNGTRAGTGFITLGDIVGKVSSLKMPSIAAKSAEKVASNDEVVNTDQPKAKVDPVQQAKLYHRPLPFRMNGSR